MFKKLPGMSIARNLQISGGYYENVRAVISAINVILRPTAVIGYDKLKNKTQLVAKPNISVSFYGKLADILGMKPDEALGRSAYHGKADFTTSVITDAPHQADINRVSTRCTFIPTLSNTNRSAIRTCPF